MEGGGRGEIKSERSVISRDKLLRSREQEELGDNSTVEYVSKSRERKPFSSPTRVDRSSRAI